MAETGSLPPLWVSFNNRPASFCGTGSSSCAKSIIFGAGSKLSKASNFLAMGKSAISSARSVASSVISRSFSWLIGSHLKVYLAVFIKTMQEMPLLQHPTIKFEKKICWWPTDDTNTCGSKVGGQNTFFQQSGSLRIQWHRWQQLSPVGHFWLRLKVV